MIEYCKIKIFVFLSSSFIKTLVPCLLNCMNNKSCILYIIFIIIVISYLHYDSTVQSVQFNCLSICHSAISCIIIIFVNYLASKIYEK